MLKVGYEKIPFYTIKYTAVTGERNYFLNAISYFKMVKERVRSKNTLFEGAFIIF